MTVLWACRRREGGWRRTARAWACCSLCSCSPSCSGSRRWRRKLSGWRPTQSWKPCWRNCWSRNVSWPERAQKSLTILWMQQLRPGVRAASHCRPGSKSGGAGSCRLPRLRNWWSWHGNSGEGAHTGTKGNRREF